MLYDVFISHAWEDKDPFVGELARKLIAHRVEVWYDDISLKPGDSLRASIDQGLSKSRFGIVVLSHYFFSKQWTNWELDGLLQRHNNPEGSVIIPIWHNIDRNDVVSYSPSLANIVALKSNRGIDNVVAEILKLLNPQGSSLVIARNILFNYNFHPPVITDDWWLDVVEYLGTCEGLKRFEFPIPYYGNTPRSRGLRIAWAAMQQSWQDYAEELGMSQITHPSVALKFIASQPGMTDICHSNIIYLLEYFPLLTLKGFGGEFENKIEELYLESKIKHQTKQLNGDRGSTELIIDKEVPLCDEIFALRDISFGNYEAAGVACKFVQGELFGPCVRHYENFDYLLWLLSSNSSWMPLNCREFLIKGMKEWDTWLWHSCDSKFGNSTSDLWREVNNCAKNRTVFKLTKRIITDIKTRIVSSCEDIEISDNVDELFDKFIEEKFIEASIAQKLRRKK